MKEYSELKYWVNAYYDVQESRMEIGSVISALQRNALRNRLIEMKIPVKKELTLKEKKEGEKEESLKSLTGKLSKKIGEKTTQKIIDSAADPRYINLFNHIYESEEMAEKSIKEEIEGIPIWGQYLKKVKGVGVLLAGGLISFLDPAYEEKKHNSITYVSCFWQYAGLTPESKRKKGEKLNFNPHLKSLCWKIGKQLLMAKNKGVRFYEEYKAKDYRKHPELHKYDKDTKKGGAKHLHDRAARYLEKKFLLELWYVWRKLEGLPHPNPYPMMKGHSGYEQPGQWFVD